MNDYVLITGASSGIGKALAYEFAAHGDNILLIARNKNALENIAADITEKYKIKVRHFPIDLTGDNSAEKVKNFCSENALDVKILINNAGMGAQGNFTDISLERQEQIINLNISAVTKMCHAFLPDMKKKKSGKIVNISSTTAFMPLANEAVYAASKAFILSFSQALYEELKPFGVTVCTLCPGVTNTDFFKSADFTLDKFKGADPADFAKFAYKKIAAGKALSVHRFSNRIISVWARLSPRGTVRRTSAKFG